MSIINVIVTAKGNSNYYHIVKWGKEQPKITNLALTPQP